VPFGYTDFKESFEAIGILRAFCVGAGNDKPQIAKHFGNAAHSDAADTDKVNALYVSKHSV
jgi:hypothetical protein